jgi:hypothetical protein
VLKIKAQNMLLAKAIEGQKAGEDEKSNWFFAMYNILLKEDTLVVSQDKNEIQIITNPAVIPQGPPGATNCTYWNSPQKNSRAPAHSLGGQKNAGTYLCNWQSILFPTSSQFIYQWLAVGISQQGVRIREHTWCTAKAAIPGSAVIGLAISPSLWVSCLLRGESLPSWLQLNSFFSKTTPSRRISRLSRRDVRGLLISPHRPIHRSLWRPPQASRTS